MTPELNALLKAIQDLNRKADQPGAISVEELEAEIKRLTLAVKEGLAQVGKQLPPEIAGAASSMVLDVFKVQMGTLLQKSGLGVEQTERMRKLAEELEGIKRTFIRG